MMLLTKEIREKLPAIHSQDGVGEDAMVHVKFFTPDANWTWYVTEGGPVLEEGDVEVDYEFYALVDGHELEWGYVNLSELESVKGPMGLHIERDRSWRPMTVRQLRQIIERRPLESEARAIIQEAQDALLESLVTKPFEQCEVEAEDGQKVTLSVQPTATKDEVAQYGRWLTSDWCKCGHSEFLCYPEDGACSCGVHKHHVHCKNCGGVSQVG